MPRTSKSDTTAQNAVEGGVRLRALMRRLRYTWGDVAKLSGVGTDALRAQQWQGWPSRRARARVELALGTPIWSDPVEFGIRIRHRHALGFDPELATRDQLREAARRLGLQCYAAPDRDALQKVIFANLAANPRLGTIKPNTP